MTGKQIKRIRKRMGLTQTEFAERMGASFATINRWEGGHFQPLPVFEQRLKQMSGRKKRKHD